MAYRGLQNATVDVCSHLRKRPFSIKSQGIGFDSLGGSWQRQSSLCRMLTFLGSVLGTNPCRKEGKNVEFDREKLSWDAVLTSLSADPMGVRPRQLDLSMPASNTHWVWATLEGVWPNVRQLSIAEDISESCQLTVVSVAGATMPSLKGLLGNGEPMLTPESVYVL